MIAHIYPSVLQGVLGRGYAGCLDGCFQGYRGGAMQDRGYELLRIPLPRTLVHRGKREGWVQGKPTSNSGKEQEPLRR